MPTPLIKPGTRRPVTKTTSPGAGTESNQPYREGMLQSQFDREYGPGYEPKRDDFAQKAQNFGSALMSDFAKQQQSSLASSQPSLSSMAASQGQGTPSALPSDPRQALVQIAGSAAPTAAEIDRARQAQEAAAKKAYEDFLSGGEQAKQAQLQSEYLAALKKRIETGEGSPIEAQMKQALQASQRQIASQIATQRGMNPALAARLLAQQQTEQAQAIAGKTAEAKLAEQQQLQQQYAQALQAQRGQDIQASAAQADAVAKLQEAVRTGDQNAINSAISAMQAVRQGDIQLTDQQRAERQAQAAQAIEYARMENSKELLRIQSDLDAKRISEAEAVAQRKKADENLMKAIYAVGLVAAGVLISVGTGGAATGVVAPAVAGAVTKVLASAKGGRIHGKARVDGDDERNDTVPALLSPGEIVIPRSIAQSPGAADKAKKFVEALEREENGSKSSKKSASQRIAKLEAELAAAKAARAKSRR